MSDFIKARDAEMDRLRYSIMMQEERAILGDGRGVLRPPIPVAPPPRWKIYLSSLVNRTIILLRDIDPLHVDHDPDDWEY